MKDSKLFQEVIMVIKYELNRDSFTEIFGESLGKHLSIKLRDVFLNDIARWICYLDNSNIDSLYRYAINKIESSKDQNKEG